MVTLLLGKDLSTETGELSDSLVFFFLTFKTRVYVLSTPSPRSPLDFFQKTLLFEQLSPLQDSCVW